MNVNKNMFEEKWGQIRTQTKLWWSLFSDEDLTKVEKAPVKLDKYAMMLRMKYGFTHEGAREEINKRVADLEINPPTIELIGNAPNRPDDLKASTAQRRRTKKPKPFSYDTEIE